MHVLRASCLLTLALVAVGAALSGGPAPARPAAAHPAPPLPPPLRPPSVPERESAPSLDPDCRTGCTLAAHDVPVVDAADIEQLVARYATEPMSAASPALETLLFHGAAVSAWLDAQSADVRLDAIRRAFLARELARTHAVIELRVVTVDGGAERIRLERTRVPLDIKQHLAPTFTGGLPPMEFSGTVKRVGLEHLWTRFWLEATHFVAGPWFTVRQSGSDWAPLGTIVVSDGHAGDLARVEYRVTLAEGTT